MATSYGQYTFVTLAEVKDYLTTTAYGQQVVLISQHSLPKFLQKKDPFFLNVY